MKFFVASNSVTANWWNGTAFSDDGVPAVLSAPALAMLRATYDNVIATEIVTLPTVSEADSCGDEAVPTYDDMICENCGCFHGN